MTTYPSEVIERALRRRDLLVEILRRHGLKEEAEEVFDALSAARAELAEREEALEALTERAAREPLDVDISDYSNEWCLGFLHGQVNALAALSPGRERGGE